MPTSIHINTFGTGRVSEEKIEQAVRETFDLRPRAIIEALNLKRPIYRNSAAYGHFGRENCGFTWEDTPHAGVFADLCGCKAGVKV